VWDQPAALLPFNYITALQRAGALAVMIPPDAALVDRPDDALDLVDGLVLAGGADIDPASYGHDPHPLTVDTVPAREIALVRGAIERDIPVLGICRGMQLINVACGGTLVQHLPDVVGHEEHRRVIGSFDGSDHEVVLADGSLAATAAGEATHVTMSHHHQAVDELGDGLVVSGTSSFDRFPEAIEMPGRTFVLGVQWHPEADESSSVIQTLVQAAARSSAATAGS
jgi:putative glutamine amidotransferase